MGLRTKIKNIIKKRFWKSKEQKQPDTQVAESIISKQNTMSQDTNQAEKNAMVGEKEEIIDKREVIKEEEIKIQPDKGTQEHREQDSNKEGDKISRHRRKARLGLLRFVAERDNSVDLASLHNYSEMRYLIGHKSFSDLMEEMVADEVLLFDPNESQAHLTEKGRLEIES